MFGPKELEKYNSPFSGEVKLLKGWGYKYVSTSNLTQSGGLVNDVWLPILKQYTSKGKSWLILGLATGTAAQIISNKYSPISIDGVEIDPIMIDLGKRHFNLGSIPNLKIHLQDAKVFVQNSQKHYDFILVDLYLADKLPNFVYQKQFLHRLKKLGRTVIINHLFYDEPKKLAAAKLLVTLKLIFPDIKLQRVLTNLILICSH